VLLSLIISMKVYPCFLERQGLDCSSLSKSVEIRY